MLVFCAYFIALARSCMNGRQNATLRTSKLAKQSLIFPRYCVPSLFERARKVSNNDRPSFALNLMENCGVMPGPKEAMFIYFVWVQFLFARRNFLARTSSIRFRPLTYYLQSFSHFPSFGSIDYPWKFPLQLDPLSMRSKMCFLSLRRSHHEWDYSIDTSEPAINSSLPLN